MSLWKLLATLPKQSVLQGARYLARRIIDTVYEGSIRLLCRYPVVVRSLAMPYVMHVRVMLLFAVLIVKYTHLGPTCMV